jgi:YD repeat-containing protein
MKNVKVLGLALLLSVFGVSALPQGNNGTGAQTISASRDQTGQHPATAPVAGPTAVKCLTAKSDVPNPQPEPSCHIVVVGPDGFSKDLPVGVNSHFNRSGRVTLTCNGQGKRVECTARVGSGSTH